MMQDIGKSLVILKLTVMYNWEIKIVIVKIEYWI